MRTDKPSIERRVAPDERYRSGWCCDYDFETGQYRTGDCIGPTRNADVVEKETWEQADAAFVELVRILAMMSPTAESLEAAIIDYVEKGAHRALNVLAREAEIQNVS